MPDAAARDVPWLDRALGHLAPRWQLRRTRARVALDLLHRHYEAASIGRRTAGWSRRGGDANTATGVSLARLRDRARDLVRNNPYAESALETIVDHTVGWGLKAAATHTPWAAWSETPACDADGRHDLAGLQKLVLRTVAESGEVLVRRRWRRVTDGLPLPLQLQVLDPDYLDTSQDRGLPTGGRVIHDVELDALGRRVAYWLFRDHPGSSQPLVRGGATSRRVPATEVAHVFRADRPGQQRGVSWFAPVLLRFKDFDEFEDATLVKQKVAACLAVITSDVHAEDEPTPLGQTTPEAPEQDTLQPGMILHVPSSRQVATVQPPTVREYADYTRTTLQAIATGLGVTYEDLTGNYTGLPFSAARMSRLRHGARVDDWRWRLLVPQFLTPVWGWAMEAAAIIDAEVSPVPDWTPPPLPMIEPDKEGLAIMRNIRAGITTLQEEIRARGYNVDDFLDELQEGFAELDKRGLVLDCDPRQMSQAGQAQAVATRAEPGEDGA